MPVTSQTTCPSIPLLKPPCNIEGKCHQAATTVLLFCVSLLMSTLTVAAQVGALDPSFSVDGKMSFDGPLNGGLRDDFTEDIALQTDDKILVVGGTEFVSVDADVLVARITTAGILDTTFNGDGIYTESIDAGGNKRDVATAVAMLSDGRILVGGWSNTDTDRAYWLRRLTHDGNPDPTFMGTSLVTETGVDLAVTDLLIEPGGTFLTLIRTTNSGTSADRVYRYSADGATRTLVGTLSPEYRMSSMTLALDGSTWLAGWYQHPVGDNDLAAARVVGTTITSHHMAVDLGSSTATRDDYAFNITMQADKPVLVGCSEHDNGLAAIAMRLLSNGAVDTSFGVAGLVNLIQSDDVEVCMYGVSVHGDKLVMAGSGGHTVEDDLQFVYRLAEDGSIDPTFGTNGAVCWHFDLGGNNHDQTTGMRIDSRDRILIGGHAATSNGTTDATVTRIAQELFADGFESGDTGRWSLSSP